MAFSSSNGYFFLTAAGMSLSVSSIDATAAFTKRLAAPAAAVPLHPVRPVAATKRRSESVGDRRPPGGEAIGAGGTFNVAPTLAAFNLRTRIAMGYYLKIISLEELIREFKKFPNEITKF